MTYKATLIAIALAGVVASCTQSEAPRASTDEVTEIALPDVPKSVSDVVMAARDDFTMTEVLKKVRDGRVYYDVEGELPGGAEIEFDVLMTSDGPQIVEVQRDIAVADLPVDVRRLVDGANKDALNLVRVIESTQTDSSIIYEVFVDGQKSDPRFEVQVTEGVSKLLTSRWEH